MAKYLRLLVIEDSEDDFKLLLAELKSRDYSPSLHRIQTEKEMRAALLNHEWDVVIADYVLPQFSAPVALKILKESKRDIPFIVISGVYGEEAAVEMMKAGAHDYIVKSNLSRLAPALEREMSAVHSRQIKARAEAAMQHLAAIVEHSEEAIYSKNLDGIIVSWNPAAERIFGYRAEEIIGQSNAILFPENRRDELLDIMAGVGRNEILGFKETYRRRKDGKTIPVAVSISPIKGADGEVIGASAIARDLTEPMLAEYERFKLIEDLTEALSRVRTLSGLLPICASCKKIRDDSGYWHQVEDYLKLHSDAEFSHGICPECKEMYCAQFPAEAPPKP